MLESIARPLLVSCQRLALSKVGDEFSHARDAIVGPGCGEAFQFAGPVRVADAEDAGVWADSVDVAERVADQNTIGRVRAQFLDRASDQVRVRFEQVGVGVVAP